MIKREEVVEIIPTTTELAREVSQLNCEEFSIFLNEVGKCIELLRKTPTYNESIINGYGKIALSKFFNPIKIPSIVRNPYE